MFFSSFTFFSNPHFSKWKYQRISSSCSFQNVSRFFFKTVVVILDWSLLSFDQLVSSYRRKSLWSRWMVFLIFLFLDFYDTIILKNYRNFLLNIFLLNSMLVFLFSSFFDWRYSNMDWIINSFRFFFLFFVLNRSVSLVRIMQIGYMNRRFKI